MFSVNLESLKVNEAELKAYIYQQLNAIQPWVGESPVSIKMAYNEDKLFEVTILASPEMGEVEVIGTHEDVYSALANAKDALIESLRTVNLVDDDDEPAERDQEIADIMAGKNHLH
jgi:ribosome-associated translation inhibitor RaiA